MKIILLIIAISLFTVSLLSAASCCDKDKKGGCKHKHGIEQGIKVEADSSKKHIENSSSKGLIYKYEVFGMDCPGCHGGVNNLIEKIPGVLKAEASWKKKLVIITIKEGEKVEDKKILKAIRDANFTPGKRLQ